MVKNALMSRDDKYHDICFQLDSCLEFQLLSFTRHTWFDKFVFSKGELKIRKLFFTRLLSFLINDVGHYKVFFCIVSNCSSTLITFRDSH